MPVYGLSTGYHGREWGTTVHDELIGPESNLVTIDELSARLSELRQGAGAPSYAEIAARIARQRLERGLSPERARIARSTVYDVFRPGRKRLDVELIREILVALGLDAVEVKVWTEQAKRAIPATTPAVPSSPPSRVDATPATPAAIAPVSTSRPWRRTAVLLLACLALNLLGRELVDSLGLPIYLDMTGTAVAAIIAGPWWGVLVAVATNLSGVTISGVQSIPFVLVNIAGALVWGYGVRRWGMGRTIPRFFSLTLLVAFVCSCIATPILVLYTGVITHGSEPFTANLIAIANAVVVGTFLSNLLFSLIDKTISGVVALIVVEARSPGAMSRGMSPAGSVGAPAAAPPD